MVKGLARQVVVLNAPDQRFFEQAIFIVRNDAPAQGVSAEALVEEARMLAATYSAGEDTRSRFLRLPPWAHALWGAGTVGIIWACCAFL